MTVHPFVDFERKAGNGLGVRDDSKQLTGLPPATSLRRAGRILGNTWTMLILKEAINGVRRFGEFQRNLNIPKQTLSQQLAELCRNEMLYRKYLNANAGTVYYQPTPKTFDLQQAMYSIWLWHRANPGPIEVLPFDLIHETCGQVLSATYRCTKCNDPITNTSLTITPTEPRQYEGHLRPRLSRRNDSAFSAVQGREDTLIAASVVGDSPSTEILYTLFKGPRHLGALARELQIGKPVLRDRLDKLIALGMIQETKEGRLSVFATLPRSDKIYPLVLCIAEWGDRWCNGDNPPPEIRVHSCGHLLDARMKCDHCGGWISHRNIRIRAHEAEPADGLG